LATFLYSSHPSAPSHMVQWRRPTMTNTSPGFLPMMTLSGTRESAHPIHNIFGAYPVIHQPLFTTLPWRGKTDLAFGSGREEAWLLLVDTFRPFPVGVE